MSTISISKYSKEEFPSLDGTVYHITGQANIEQFHGAIPIMSIQEVFFKITASKDQKFYLKTITQFQNLLKIVSVAK